MLDRTRKLDLCAAGFRPVVTAHAPSWRVVRQLLRAGHRTFISWNNWDLPQCSLIDEMVPSARNLGATSLIGIVPEHSPWLARRTEIDCVAAGTVIETADGERSVCLDIALASKLH